MLDNSPKSNTLYTNRRKPRADLRRILIAMSLLVLALGTTGPPSPVQAAPLKSWTFSTLRVSPIDNPLKVCEGEKVTFTVLIERNEATWTQLPIIGGRFTYPPALIQASSSDINAGYITPGSANTSLRPNSIRNVASFTFKAKKKGTTTLRFVDDGGSGRPTASDVTRNIEVKKCNYELIVDGQWIDPAAFLTIKLNTHFEAILEPDENGRIAPKTVGVYDSGHHLQSAPFCSPSVTPANGEATITGQLDVNRGTLDLEVTFGPINATSNIDCLVPIPVPGANFGKGSEGKGQQFVLDPPGVTIRAGAGTSVRVEDHKISAVSTVRGKSVIIIIPIYLD